MPLKTVKVEVKLVGPDSAPLVNALVEATLSGYELDGGVVVPSKVRGYTNSLGLAYLDLWPNARGSASTHYSVRVVNYPGLFDVEVVVPDSPVSVPVSIKDIINAAPYPPLNASEQALLAAQAATVAATAQALLAQASANDSAAQAVIANAQRGLAQTAKAGADVARTGSETAQTAAQTSATAAALQAAIADQQRVLAQTAKTAADAALASATTQANTSTAQAVIAAQQRALSDTAKSGADTAKTGADTAAAAAAASAATALGAFPGMVAVYIDSANNAMAMRTLFINHVGTQP